MSKLVTEMYSSEFWFSNNRNNFCIHPTVYFLSNYETCRFFARVFKTRSRRADRPSRLSIGSQGGKHCYFTFVLGIASNVLLRPGSLTPFLRTREENKMGQYSARLHKLRHSYVCVHGFNRVTCWLEIERL